MEPVQQTEKQTQARLWAAPGLRNVGLFHLRAARTAIHLAKAMAALAGTFLKYCGPCGQPAVEGGIGSFRPVPAHVGHFDRINATPSDLPFMSNGFATYPVPRQLGQSSGLTPLPLD